MRNEYPKRRCDSCQRKKPIAYGLKTCDDCIERRVNEQAEQETVRKVRAAIKEGLPLQAAVMRTGVYPNRIAREAERMHVRLPLMNEWENDVLPGVCA